MTFDQMMAERRAIVVKQIKHPSIKRPTFHVTEHGRLLGSFFHDTDGKWVAGRRRFNSKEEAETYVARRD